jgi:hypothetical protein
MQDKSIAKNTKQENPKKRATKINNKERKRFCHTHSNCPQSKTHRFCSQQAPRNRTLTISFQTQKINLHLLSIVIKKKTNSRVP